VEKASGSSLFIPSENTRNSSPLNDNGKITNRGAIKYMNTHEHINKYI
jgi:hypothetical protein